MEALPSRPGFNSRQTPNRLIGVGNQLVMKYQHSYCYILNIFVFYIFNFISKRRNYLENSHSAEGDDLNLLFRYGTEVSSHFAGSRHQSASRIFRRHFAYSKIKLFRDYCKIYSPGHYRLAHSHALRGGERID